MTNQPMRFVAAGALAGAAVLAAACTGAEKAPSTVSLPSDQRILFFGPGATGATLVTSQAVTSVQGPGAEPNSTPYHVPTGAVSSRPGGGSVDLSGQPWWVANDAVPTTPSGTVHPGAAHIRELQGAVGQATVRHTDAWATAVVDGDAVLVPTNTVPGTTARAAVNSVVYRVTAQGSRPVAGVGGKADAARVSTLQRRSAPATSVRLELVQATAPLTTDSFALVMSTPSDDEEDATLQAAYVRDGMVSSVPLPGQCAGQHVVHAVRSTDTRIVVSAPHHDKTQGCTQTMDWVEVDLPTGNVATLGSGDGYAYLDADGRLVTATRTSDDPGKVAVQWQDRPAG